MDTEKKRKSLFPLLTLLVSLVAFSLDEIGFIRFLNRPDLRCRSLEPYETSTEAVSGILVENRGRAVSKNVVVRFSTENEIFLDLKAKDFVGSSPELLEGGTGRTYAVYTLSRLSHNTSGTIYVKTRKPIGLIVSCEDDTGLARPADSAPERQWLTRFLEILGLASVLYFFLTISRDSIVEALRKKQQGAEN